MPVGLIAALLFGAAAVVLVLWLSASLAPLKGGVLMSRDDDPQEVGRVKVVDETDSGERHEHQREEQPQTRGDQMPEELQDLFGLSESQPPGMVETWLRNKRERHDLRQRQRTLEEQAELYELQAQADTQQAGALEKRTQLLAKRIALGLISPQSQAYLKRHLPQLWERSSEQAELLELDHEVEREKKKTEAAKHRAERNKHERAADYSKLGFYYAQWQELIDRVKSDLRGSAQGYTTLVKELKGLLKEIDSDDDLSDEEKEFLRKKLEQEFKNLAANWK